MQSESEVCVIGAGISGILAVKYCLEYGLSVICYEQRSAIGGLWTGSTPDVSQINEDGRPRVAVYETLKMDISRTLTSFTDFPLAESLLPSIDPKDRFLAGKQFLEYLGLFVQHFKLERHVQLSTQVLEVAKIKAEEEEEDEFRWAVTVRREEIEGLATRTSRHRYVIVASGFYSEAFIPEVRNLSEKYRENSSCLHVQQDTCRLVCIVK